ncbi:MAG TPA: pyridoxamine 5'-phosphate oxidase family protein [Syntrophomonadaceae bacterium]|nr:pyridoxamine 5'-phosphate oxidase family protein [Syntrophomonadaceae bacterium]
MNEKTKKLCLELMENAEAAFLTTIDGEDFPETRAMFNLRRKAQFPALLAAFEEHQDDFLIYFTTNTSSRKLKHIQANHKASVYYCQPIEWRGLNMVGSIEIVNDRDVKQSLWQDGWEMYYPGGADDPDYSVLCMRPRFARYYHQLQVSQLDFPRADVTE